MDVTTVKITATVSVGWSVSYPSGVTKKLWRAGFPESAGQVALVSCWESACIRHVLPEAADPHPRSSLCSVLNYFFLGSTGLYLFSVY